MALTAWSMLLVATAVIALRATNTRGPPTAQDNAASPDKDTADLALVPRQSAKELAHDGNPRSRQ
jgi:hypothetical protein